MLKSKALLLTQGMHGMISQVEGLSKALGFKFKHETVRLKNIWNLVPPKFTLISEIILENRFICDSKVIISCGRKSVIPSILLKKRFKKDVFTIHVQDPKVNLNNFDCIICPEHDNLEGENVIKTKGAIHYLTNEEIKKNTNYLDPRADGKKIITLILGGPNKYYGFSEKQMTETFAKIKNLFIYSKYKLIVIPSYRTPENIVKLAFNYFNDNHLVIKEKDKKAYLSSLGLADIIIVTCDSTSMISEAAMTGKPIYIAQMPNIKKNRRFKKFFELFKNLNITKNLEDKLDQWTYEKLNETDRISGYIKNKLKNYDFS